MVDKERTGDAANILEVGPLMETGQEVPVVLWQDVHDSLPTANADPEVDLAGAQLVPSAVSGGARVGLERLGDSGQGVEVCAANFGGAVGGAKVGATCGEVACVDVEDLDEDSTHSASVSPRTSRSVTASSKSCAGRPVDEYIRISISELGVKSGEREEFSARLAREQLEFSVDGALGSPCMSYTGPDSNMQLVPRKARDGPVLEEVVVPVRDIEEATAESAL
jgi:hypothetical protein